MSDKKKLTCVEFAELARELRGAIKNKIMCGHCKMSDEEIDNAMDAVLKECFGIEVPVMNVKKIEKFYFDGNMGAE
ncbi:MAG: hypothetical protein ABII97_01205 [Patescibacteria group bacterium]